MSEALERLSRILDILRSECPWDRAQTLESLRYLTLEEVYELSDAILAYCDAAASDTDGARNAAMDIKKELGDLLMHILFYSKIADDDQLFTFDDVCHAVSDKLVSRHPHIALPLRDGTMREASSDAFPGWEQVKMREGRRSVFDGVPRALPSLAGAVRLQEKAGGIGYHEQADDKLDRLLDSLPTDSDAVGELLFAWVGRLDALGVNADEALAQANRRFIQRASRWERQNTESLRTD